MSLLRRYGRCGPQMTANRAPMGSPDSHPGSRYPIGEPEPSSKRRRTSTSDRSEPVDADGYAAQHPRRQSLSSGDRNAATKAITSSSSTATNIIAAKPPDPSSRTDTGSIRTQRAPLVHKRRFTCSRSGCNTCRVRKVECDETRPHCRRCLDDR